MRSSPSVLIGLLAVAEVLLIAVTWPLWFVQTEYPQVALLAADAVPLAVDQFLSTVLVFSCLTIAVQQCAAVRKPATTALPEAASRTDQRRGQLAPTIALATAVLLAILDQHRLQPWHWLAILLLAEWRVLCSSDFRSVARATLASIYLFAAASRFGPDVASEMSGQVLRLILDSVGLETVKSGSNEFFWLAVVMNAAEFGVGLGLLFKATRRTAVVAACLLHLTLLLCLSPLGLNHHSAVIIWNGFLLSAVLVTFWPNVRSEFRLTTKGRLVIAAVFLIPASGLFGIADNWLSWQVYSPRPEQLRLTVREDSVRFLPESLRVFVQPPRPLQSECLIRLDRWSLACKHVPVYPEDRFQIAVAKDVVEQAIARGATKDAFSLELEFPRTFWWWQRDRIKRQL